MVWEKILQGEEIIHTGGTKECMEWIQEFKGKGGTKEIGLEASYKVFHHCVSRVKENKGGGLVVDTMDTTKSYQMKKKY